MSSIQQSALAQSPAAFGLDLQSEVIVCTPFWNLAMYKGTRAALESEGLIPAGTRWPSAFNKFGWRQGRMWMQIRRLRPEGMKGPRRNFADVDWWELRIDPAAPQDYAAIAIARKVADLQAAIYEQTPKGAAERRLQTQRFLKSIADDAYQSFKSSIPGLIPPPRPVRQAKAQGESA